MASDVAASGGRAVAMFMPQNGPPNTTSSGATSSARSLAGAGSSSSGRRAHPRPGTARDRLGLRSTPRRPGSRSMRGVGDYFVNEPADPRAPPRGRQVGDIARAASATSTRARHCRCRQARGWIRPVRLRRQRRMDVGCSRRRAPRPRVVLGASDRAHMDMMVGADFLTRCLGELVRERRLHARGDGPSVHRGSGSALRSARPRTLTKGVGRHRPARPRQGRCRTPHDPRSSAGAPDS
jgi:hypothetical protein